MSNEMYTMKHRFKFDLAEYQRYRNSQEGMNSLIAGHGNELFMHLLEFFQLEQDDVLDKNPDLPSYAMAVLGNTMATLGGLMRETYPSKAAFNKALEDLLSVIFKTVQNLPDAAALEQMYGHEEWADEQKPL
jgi:hypothetical protein